MLRKLLLTLAAILALVLLTIVGLFGYALTQSGQRQLASLLGRQLSSPGREIELAGLSLRLPFDLWLGALRLRDGQGVWLEIEDARVDLVPSALLHAEIAIGDVGARRVALHRLPSS